MENKDKINPSHHRVGWLESIEILRKILTEEQYKGYLIGSAMKYRMRAGKKEGESTEDDIEKALWFEEKIAKLPKISI